MTLWSSYKHRFITIETIIKKGINHYHSILNLLKFFILLRLLNVSLVSTLLVRRIFYGIDQSLEKININLKLRLYILVNI